MHCKALRYDMIIWVCFGSRTFFSVEESELIIEKHIENQFDNFDRINEGMRQLFPLLLRGLLEYKIFDKNKKS